MGLGASLEGNAGFVRATVSDPVGAERDETVVTAGVSLNFEFDFVRDASFGMGYGYQTLRSLEADGAAVEAVPFGVWYGGSIENRGWRLRPRASFGFSMDRGETDQYMDVNMLVGASYHYKRGRALHFMVGPQAVFARDYGLGGDTDYRGWGGQLRIRLFRMMLTDCDPKDREHAAKMAKSDNPC